MAVLCLLIGVKLIGDAITELIRQRHAPAVCSAVLGRGAHPASDLPS